MSKNCGGPCGDHARPAADTDIQASSEAPGRWVSVYAVPKMDCPSEERMIRLALSGFEEIRALSFDLSNRRLKVVHDGEVARVRHQNADFAFLVKPLPCESTTYAHFCGSFVVATA